MEADNQQETNTKIGGDLMKDAMKRRKSDLCDYLKTSIKTLQLHPGSHLDETQLSQAFGLSRTPLREVLHELAGEGYVEFHMNRGARVSQMSHTSLRDFFLAAPMIYGAILRLAALNATPKHIITLKEAQDAFKSALRADDISARALANNRFHEITGEMAGNTYLLPSFYRLLIDHARIGMTFYHPQYQKTLNNLSKASAQHDEIIAAIEAGDAERAEQLAEQHWNLSRGQIEHFVMPEPLEMRLGPWMKIPA